MHDLNKKHGTTFVFSTHDPKAMERASRLVHIRDGLIDHI
jgi:putative ABC transport system ATP-binding protein